MSMIDAASGGALVDKTPAAARGLIYNMAANSQQFSIRHDPNPPPKSINEVSNSNENQLGHPLAQLTTVQTTQASIKSSKNQVGQLETSYNRLEAHLSNKLPSQPEKNPKDNVSVITLQSGIQCKPPTQPSLPAPGQKQVVNNSIHDESSMQKKSHKPTMSTYVPHLPFPSRLKKFKKEEVDKEILETFRKVEVNIPLLDAIKQVPCYAKFLKELCTNKKKLKGDEKISVGENVSAILQKKLPPKCKDPGTFTIPCMTGNKRIEQCMIDLGALITGISYSSHASLNLGPLKETRVIVQLANHTNAYPLGVVEDVLVKIDSIVFPADFYILEMGDASIPNPTPVLFGRPFLMTKNTKVDVRVGTLTMKFDGEVIKFNMFDSPGKMKGTKTSLKYPT
ncbi:uncharacterized protein LOC133792378 [Humulus lupulus]|uniref:uncharacterized protein LOC133792378 n=1 Tax=Humulus lupulus TaxID=3486 RepID=UPI002B4126BC|nr:uncharacterized protein LOC133792378 [Humulus lupulus]